MVPSVSSTVFFLGAGALVGTSVSQVSGQVADESFDLLKDCLDIDLIKTFDELEDTIDDFVHDGEELAEDLAKVDEDILEEDDADELLELDEKRAEVIDDICHVIEDHITKTVEAIELCIAVDCNVPVIDATDIFGDDFVIDDECEFTEVEVCEAAQA